MPSVFVFSDRCCSNFISQEIVVCMRKETLHCLIVNLQVFEDDAVQWEDKLNRILTLFDVWIDVQRRWVYLDGIFSGSGDIQHLLPIETQRFQR